ncbi:hypothetical protein ACFO25_08010 [Paenactinomyces guangxiensis]|uniref:Uncharacterized protein n=1 Tax=Paenactinomyces guangxiensis TaxID=1490290 RepID=A0A7W1WN92_9BACL|nr:hypothetical protein [Paenactinomyces guangxiensis]MBA4493011.1 hypothetical protein [Paenactinomyces guangxiensis]MBH8590140.1 hypothetical protein [Paenactinomyces guangxiensis]
MWRALITTADPVRIGIGSAGNIIFIIANKPVHFQPFCIFLGSVGTFFIAIKAAS